MQRPRGAAAPGGARRRGHEPPDAARRLRVDLYEDDGTWFDSSDFGRPDPRDWPASFSVFSDDESRDRVLLVRLRAYPEGAVSSYTGERFRDGANLFDAAAGNGEPRLMKDGRDVTPSKIVDEGAVVICSS